MLKISKIYEKKKGNNLYSIGVFDLYSDLTGEKALAELKEFSKNHCQSYGRVKLLEKEEEQNCKITLEMKYLDIAEILVYRFNMVLMGRKVESDKKEYLKNFSLEGLKAIVYATDLMPKEVSIDQYVASVLSAYESYNDSILFSKRIIELLDPETHLDFGIASQQISLFINLLSINGIDGESENHEANFGS